ncbi:MAG: BLUF domain-containing protein [Geminicoccaceae bacterium]|nr:BLUF domain-containing protein [Geminicoccaceae bacterium]
MPKTLHRLVYYSKNAIDLPKDGLEAEVRQILTAARHNNPALGVTGALMFNQGCFAQVLEGPGEGVTRTFERIQRDPRHRDVMLMAFDRVEERGFATWSMAFVGASAEGRARYGGIAAESGFDPSRLTGSRVFQLLRDLVVEEEDQPCVGA